METENTQTIGEVIDQALSPPNPKRSLPKSPAQRTLRLLESGEFDGFSTLDVVNGLRGICAALDEIVITDNSGDVNLIANLCQAAKVMSSIVQNRVMTP